MTWLLLLLLFTPTAWAAEVESLLGPLRAVGPKGKGSHEAAQAWKELIEASADELPAILAGMDGANPLAANWIGSAADTIAQRELQQGGTLPAAELERFLMDAHHAPRARSQVYEWLSKTDPTLPARVLPKMLDDPNLDLRRLAVARLMAEAAKAPEARALDLYDRALRSTREMDQLRQIAGRLKKLGREVILTKQLGCVTHWKVIGPWDNTDGRGFDAVYPPEKETVLDFSQSYPGKPDAKGNPRTLKWIDHTTTHPLGEFDLNKILEEEKSVVAYAAGEVYSPRAQDVQIRTASNNAHKIWINGHEVAAYKVYHAGGQFDQYSCDATLRPGRNTILVKICQNAQTQPWARDWKIILRVCDRSGGPVVSDSKDQP
ncbi:MAG: hypothetical protein JW818_15390 [Pirellulales bacterium]|nr:hypothetical protein [Pirellulales bacterium]